MNHSLTVDLYVIDDEFIFVPDALPATGGVAAPPPAGGVAAHPLPPSRDDNFIVVENGGKTKYYKKARQYQIVLKHDVIEGGVSESKGGEDDNENISDDQKIINYLYNSQNKIKDDTFKKLILQKLKKEGCKTYTYSRIIENGNPVPDHTSLIYKAKIGKIDAKRVVLVVSKDDISAFIIKHKNDEPVLTGGGKKKSSKKGSKKSSKKGSKKMTGGGKKSSKKGSKKMTGGGKKKSSKKGSKKMTGGGKKKSSKKGSKKSSKKGSKKMTGGGKKKSSKKGSKKMTGGGKKKTSKKASKKGSKKSSKKTKKH
jgi:hypothetical protein